jgi:hypothetical protein
LERVYFLPACRKHVCRCERHGLLLVWRSLPIILLQRQCGGGTAAHYPRLQRQSAITREPGVCSVLSTLPALAVRPVLVAHQVARVQMALACSLVMPRVQGRLASPHAPTCEPFTPTCPPSFPVCLFVQTLLWSGPVLGSRVPTGSVVQVLMCAYDPNAEPVCTSTFVGIGEALAGLSVLPHWARLPE